MKTKRLSARLPERVRAPQWSTSTVIVRSLPQQQANGTPLLLQQQQPMAVDARFKGDKKLLHASRRVSMELARVACDCRLRGQETCTASCACVTRWKSCGAECECRASCCNSVAHTPRLGIRGGALGEELYTKTDLPRGRLAFVVCGRVMALPEWQKKLPGECHYTFPVCWEGLPPAKYFVDPFHDVTGAANHSCEPNVVVESCWANGKIYAVGRTTRNIMAKEALCVDYKWTGTGKPREFAEICRCREAKCRGLIAEKGSQFLDVSALHYEGEIKRLEERLVVAERALQERYEALAAAERAGAFGAVAEFETELIRSEDENEKLKAHIEVLAAAVTRSRAAMAEDSVMTTYVVEIPQKKETYVSPLRKLMQRIRNLFSQQEEQKELQAEITISSETNPYFTADSPLSSNRSILAEPCGNSISRSCPSFRPQLGSPSIRFHHHQLE